MKNVLLLCDDHWHPAEIIEEGIKTLKNLYNFTIVKTAKDILTPAMLQEYPVILCCKANSVNPSNTNPWFEEGVTEVGPKEFESYVKNGGGFLSLHSGNTSKPGEAYTDFVGNYFIGHPPRCNVEVKVTAEHPVTAGINDFILRDEHYNIKVTAEDAENFLKTCSESGGEQIGGYSRTIGKGRLCVLTPGHTLSVWQNESFQQLLSNAIDWCCEVNG